MNQITQVIYADLPVTPVNSVLSNCFVIYRVDDCANTYGNWGHGSLRNRLRLKLASETDFRLQQLSIPEHQRYPHSLV